MVCRAERCIGQVTKCITAIVTIRTGAFVNDRSSPIIPLRVKPPTKKDQHNFKRGSYACRASPHNANNKEEKDITEYRSNYPVHSLRRPAAKNI